MSPSAQCQGGISHWFLPIICFYISASLWVVNGEHLALASPDMNKYRAVALHTFLEYNCTLSELPVFSDNRFSPVYNLNIPVDNVRKSIFILAARTGAPASAGLVIIEVDISKGVIGIQVRNIISLPDEAFRQPVLFLDQYFAGGSRLLISNVKSNSNASQIVVGHVILNDTDLVYKQLTVSNNLPYWLFEGEFPNGSFQPLARQLVFATLQISELKSNNYTSSAVYVALDVDNLSVKVMKELDMIAPAMTAFCDPSDSAIRNESQCTYAGVAFKVRPNPLGPPCNTAHTLFWTAVNSELHNGVTVELPTQPYDDCVTLVTAQKYSPSTGVYTALLQTPLGNFPLTGMLEVNTKNGSMTWSRCSWRRMQTLPAPLGMVEVPEW